MVRGGDLMERFYVVFVKEKFLESYSIAVPFIRYYAYEKIT